MRTRISVLLGLVALLAACVFAVSANSPPAAKASSTITKKQAAPTVAPATQCDAILNEEVQPVFGDLLPTIDVERKNPFESGLRIPEAPSFKTEHVPRL